MNKNIKLLITVLLLGTILISCSQNEKKQSDSQKSEAQVAFKVAEKDLIPEGITYSSSTNSFYLGSLSKGKIIQIDAETGKFKDFIGSEILGVSVLGVFVDDSRKHLWACADGLKDGQEYSTIAKFDLLSGELLKLYEYKDDFKNMYNDLVLDKSGNVYFTDSANRTIYRINNRTDNVEEFLSGSQIENPNGITISPDGKYLYVASNSKGIRIIDLESRTIINDANSIENSEGLDGLKYYKGSLIGIQNEVKSRSDVKICRYYLSENGTKSNKMDVIDQDNPSFNIPTTFVMVKDDLYCLANSQMQHLSGKDVIRKDLLTDTIILKYEF